MKKLSSKRFFSLALTLCILFSMTVIIPSLTSLAADNGWEEGGNGGNVSIASSGTATTVTFGAAYNWMAEYATLPNKLKPVAEKTFAFRFKVTNITGGWIPVVLGWSSSPNGSLQSFGLALNITNGSVEIKNGSDTAPIYCASIANVAIDTAASHIVTVKLIDESTNLVAVYIDGNEAVRYQSVTMATQLSFAFPIYGLDGLTLTVGGGGNTQIVFDTNLTKWDVVGNADLLSISGDQNLANLNFTGGDHSSVYAQIPNKVKPVRQGLWTYGFNMKSLNSWAVMSLCWSVDSGSPVTTSSGVFLVFDGVTETGCNLMVKSLGTSSGVLPSVSINFNTDYRIVIERGENGATTVFLNNILLGTYYDTAANFLDLEFPFAGFEGLTLATGGGGSYTLAVDTTTFHSTVNYLNNTILKDQGYITKINPGTTVEQFLSGILTFGSSANVKAFKGENQLNSNDRITTGTTIKVTEDNIVTEYKAIIYGDISKDGTVDIVDILGMKSALLGYTQLEGESLQSAKISGSTTVSILDIISLRNHIIGKEAIVQY